MIKLELVQRLRLLGLLNTFKGGYEELVDVLKIVEKIKLTSEEIETYKIKVNTEKDQISWDTVVPAQEYDFTRDEKDVMVEMFEKLDKEKAWTVEQKPLAELYQQIKK